MLLIFLVTFVVMLLFQPLAEEVFSAAGNAAQQNQPAQTQPAAPTYSHGDGHSAAANSRGRCNQAGRQRTETVIENDLYRITFTNRGAQVKSWILKKFDNDAGNGPLDLVNPAAAEKFGYPLSLWTYDEGVRNRLGSALYVASREGKQTSPTTITFEYADQDLAVRKTFGFDNSYVVNVETIRARRRVPTSALCRHGPRGSGIRQRRHSRHRG